MTVLKNPVSFVIEDPKVVAVQAARDCPGHTAFTAGLSHPSQGWDLQDKEAAVVPGECLGPGEDPCALGQWAGSPAPKKPSGALYFCRPVLLQAVEIHCQP